MVVQRHGDTTGMGQHTWWLKCRNDRYVPPCTARHGGTAGMVAHTCHFSLKGSTGLRVQSLELYSESEATGYSEFEALSQINRTRNIFPEFY